LSARRKKNVLVTTDRKTFLLLSAYPPITRGKFQCRHTLITRSKKQTTPPITTAHA
jgi:hypothetical protein